MLKLLVTTFFIVQYWQFSNAGSDSVDKNSIATIGSDFSVFERIGSGMGRHFDEDHTTDLPVSSTETSGKTRKIVRRLVAKSRTVTAGTSKSSTVNSKPKTSSNLDGKVLRDKLSEAKVMKRSKNIAGIKEHKTEKKDAKLKKSRDELNNNHKNQEKVEIKRKEKSQKHKSPSKKSEDDIKINTKPHKKKNLKSNFEEYDKPEASKTKDRKKLDKSKSEDKKKSLKLDFNEPHSKSNKTKKKETKKGLKKSNELKAE